VYTQMIVFHFLPLVPFSDLASPFSTDTYGSLRFAGTYVLFHEFCIDTSADVNSSSSLTNARNRIASYNFSFAVK